MEQTSKINNKTIKIHKTISNLISTSSRKSSVIAILSISLVSTESISVDSELLERQFWLLFSPFVGVNVVVSKFVIIFENFESPPGLEPGLYERPCVRVLYVISLSHSQMS